MQFHPSPGNMRAACRLVDRKGGQSCQALRLASFQPIGYIKRGGQVWIKVFPDKSVSKKPAETRMGSGKGSPEYWVAVVKPGRVLFEIAGVSEELAREAMRLASHKLPIATKFVTREKNIGGEENEAE